MNFVRPILMSLVALLVLVNVSNAMAGSLYKAGDNTVGVGYTSVTFSFPGFNTQSGVNVDWTYFFLDNIGLSIQGHFLSGTTIFGVSDSINPIEIQAEWHQVLVNEFGFYGGVGYGSADGTVGGLAVTDQGVVFELGLEYQFAGNFVANVAYKNIGVQGGSMSGITGGISYQFYMP